MVTVEGVVVMVIRDGMRGVMTNGPVLTDSSSTQVPTNSGNERSGRSFCARAGPAAMATAKPRIRKAGLRISVPSNAQRSAHLLPDRYRRDAGDESGDAAA